MKFENPFVLGSRVRPGTNGKVIARSYDLGWGGCVIKTISLDASQGHQHRAALRQAAGARTDEVIGFENIELISDRPFDDWLDELRQLKKQYPNKMLIASIMEEYRKRGVARDHPRACRRPASTRFELNLSCPHGLPERKMGMAMGENPDIVSEVWAG
jgi:dihydroorotate dehydrogenase